MHAIATGEPGDRLLLLGNEAIARGAIEAGVEVVASYPGTPSSEIVETLLDVSSELGFYAEWSINEKVAFELAAGAALTGVRSLATMKGAGLNVVMDLFMTLPYTGTRGGLVVVVADDPGAHYSSNEQDSRFAAQWAMIPCLEPENHQEAKEMTAYAFDLSERLELPIIVRTATRLSHSSGVVELAPIRKSDMEPGFNKHWKQSYRWNVYGPPGAPAKHAWQLSQLPLMIQESEKLRFNEMRPGSEPVAIVTGGTAATYAREALRDLGLDEQLWLLKIGMPYPIPEKLSLEVLQQCDRLLVVEEGDPLVESQLRVLAQANGIEIEILGQHGDPLLPRHGELNTTIVREAIAKMMGLPAEKDETREAIKAEVAPLVIPRSSTLCAGCPHLGTYWALRKAMGEKASATHITNGDIGCYEQAGYGIKGEMPEVSDQAMAHHKSTSLYDFLDTLYIMGSGVSMAQGQIRANYKGGEVVAVAGDSTFFHTCMPGLLNAVWNGTKLTFIVMDNFWTSMTGHQACPATGMTARGQPTKTIHIEDVARSLGVEFVEVADPYNLEETIDTIRRALDHDGPAVVVTRRECMLQILRRERKYKEPYTVISEKCIRCGECVRLGCPAITFSKKEGAGIDPLLCVGCDICAQLCPVGAIVPQEEN